MKQQFGVKPHVRRRIIRWNFMWQSLYDRVRGYAWPNIKLHLKFQGPWIGSLNPTARDLVILQWPMRMMTCVAIVNVLSVARSFQDSSQKNFFHGVQAKNVQNIHAYLRMGCNHSLLDYNDHVISVDSYGRQDPLPCKGQQPIVCCYF